MFGNSFELCDFQISNSEVEAKSTYIIVMGPIEDVLFCYGSYLCLYTDCLALGYFFQMAIYYGDFQLGLRASDIIFT